jgi:murein L,D-transpeptidase YcbB/YkuD
LFERRAVYLLHGCTIAFVTTLCLLLFTPLLKNRIWEERIREEGAERNERSTPRSFVLPATPAVAEEQQKQARELSDGVDTFGCLHRLRVLGYNADDAPPAFRARNLEALSRFQRDRGMKPTGRLDPNTVRSLGCQ